MLLHSPSADPPDLATISRRGFLEACAAIALTSAGCASFGPRMRAGYAFANDPPLGAYQPVLHGLVTTLLPCEDKGFTVDPDRIVTHLHELFHLETDDRYLIVQQTLLFFDDLALFEEPAPFLDAERVAIDADAGGRTPDPQPDESPARDRARSAAFRQSSHPAKFTQLTLADRRAYFALWSDSGFVTKRRFAAAAKALVMVSAYSLDELWSAISYEGPLARH